MQFTVNHVSLEGLNIPKSDDVIKIGMSKPEYMADDKAIKEAETELGFKLGPQTKEFFKKWAGLYFSGGTEYVSDIKLAVGQTGMIFEEDDRLKNKKIDRIVVGADGFGNHLCADTNDKLSWYYHDSNPVFDTSETKSMKLFAYIEKQFAESKERKSKKSGKATESFEPALEQKLDPSTFKKGDLERSPVARIRFTVFGKEVACTVPLECGVDQTIGGQQSKLSQFNIDANMVEQLNIVIPKIDKIIEGATDRILKQCQMFHDSVTEESKTKKLTVTDLKKHFSHVGIVNTYVKQGGSWKAAIGISLDGKYSTPDVWDEEHGVGLVVVDGKVIECGASDIIY